MLAAFEKSEAKTTTRTTTGIREKCMLDDDFGIIAINLLRKFNPIT